MSAVSTDPESIGGSNPALELSPALQLLAAFRRPGDEVRWTQTIAALAQKDAAFRRSLVELLLQRTEHADRAPELRAVCDSLTCATEQTLVEPSGDTVGRVDLAFRSPTGSAALLVELKLHSGYGDAQLNRYLASLAGHRPGHAGLIAITTTASSYGEESAEDHPAWLGSLRWSELYDGLWNLEIADSGTRKMWQAMLAVMRAQGDFGLMDIDLDAITGFGKQEAGRQQLNQLLRELAPAVLEQLPARLAAGLTKSSVVAVSKLSPHVPFSLGGVKEERLRLQFRADGRQTLFSVDGYYPHPKERLESDPFDHINAKLHSIPGFFVGSHAWGYYWARVWEESAWLDPIDPLARLTALVEEGLDRLVESGLLDALSTLGAKTPATSEDQPDVGLRPVENDFA